MSTEKKPLSTSNYNRDKDFSIRPGKDNAELKSKIQALATKKKRTFNEFVEAILVDYVSAKKPKELF